MILAPNGGSRGVGRRRDDSQVMPNEERDAANLGTCGTSGADPPVVLGRGVAGPTVMAESGPLISAPNGGGRGVGTRPDDYRVMPNDGRDTTNLGTRGTPRDGSLVALGRGVAGPPVMAGLG